jgi:aminodeoxyfutalosine synthase
VGGVHPDRDLYYYAEMIRRIKEIMPEVCVKAFTAVELHYMIRKAGLSIEEGLQLLKDAGMESIPGGGAEIFDEKIRAEICPGKCSSSEWLEMHEKAHKLGFDSNATMLYGHIENIDHRIDHLMRLRDLQDRTGGFNAFIPLKFRSANNGLESLGETSIVDDMRTLAMSRLILDNVAHIKAYWVMYGKESAEMALSFGADDIDGTIEDSTKIYSMAGAADERPRLTIAEIEKMCAAAGFRAVERDTHYNEIKN